MPLVEREFHAWFGNNGFISGDRAVLHGFLQQITGGPGVRRCRNYLSPDPSAIPAACGLTWCLNGLAWRSQSTRDI